MRVAEEKEQGMASLVVPEWAELDWLWHGFSTRPGGVSRVYSNGGDGELNLGFTATDSAENVRENRRRFVQEISGNSETRLATVRQVHSNRAVVLEPGFSGWDAAPEADGMMTGERGVLLGILTADCVPVLVVDPVVRVVAGFHAGWRGTSGRIVELGVGQMQREFGSEPGRLLAAIGPAIGGCCYAVGAEVIGQFEDRFGYADELFTRSDDETRLDLIEANRRQLLAAGLDAGSVAVVGGCTSCHPDLYYSHRASGGHAGRMMAVVGIR